LCRTTDRTSNRTVPRGYLSRVIYIQFAIVQSIADAFFAGSYLEALESQLAEQNRLQSRINELEARLRELEPSATLFNRAEANQQFPTQPEVSNTPAQSSTYLAPTLESSRGQLTSSHYPNYTELSAPIVNSVNTSIAPVADQDNTDPGIFEAGGEDAGKGWYLGSASGSISTTLGFPEISSGLHELYQEYSIFW
jgi:hypothetical protein